MRSNFQPDAFSDAPVSTFRMYVCMRWNPSAFAARADAPYRNEHAFCVPSVHSRVTSTQSR